MSPEQYSPPRELSELDFTVVKPYYLESGLQDNPADKTKRELASALYRWDILRRTGVYIRPDSKVPVSMDFIEGLDDVNPHKIDRMVKPSYSNLRKRFSQYMNALISEDSVRGSNIILTMIDDQGVLLPEEPDIIENIQEIIIPTIGNVRVGHISESDHVEHTRLFNLGWKSGWDLRVE